MSNEMKNYNPPLGFSEAADVMLTRRMQTVSLLILLV